MAATSASIGLVIYAVAKSSLSTSAAIFAAVIFVAMPLSQICANAIMLEHLVTLMMFLSVVCLAKFADNERIVYVSTFSMFAVLAIFTRGSALVNWTSSSADDVVCMEVYAIKKHFPFGLVLFQC